LATPNSPPVGGSVPRGLPRTRVFISNSLQKQASDGKKVGIARRSPPEKEKPAVAKAMAGEGG